MMCGHQSRGGAWAKGNQREGSAPPANPPGRGTRTCGLRGVASTRGGGGVGQPKAVHQPLRAAHLGAGGRAPGFLATRSGAHPLVVSLVEAKPAGSFASAASISAGGPSARAAAEADSMLRRLVCCGGEGGGQQCDGSLRAGRAACMPRFGCGPPRAGRRAWSGSAEARTRCAAHARARCERADRANCERGFLQRHNDPNQRNWEKIGKSTIIRHKKKGTTQSIGARLRGAKAPAALLRAESRGAEPARET